VELANEFARVLIELDHQGNGTRLKITSRASQRVVYLDPVELEALTWMDPQVFRELLRTPFGPKVG
jgi:hypothetical protein